MRRTTAVLVLLLAAACGGASTPHAAPTAKATTKAPAVKTTAPRPAFVVTTAAGPTTFTIADHTLSCDVESAYARCDVRHHTYTPTPKPGDCHENWGFGVEYRLETASGFFCAADSILGATRVLPVGHAIQVGMVICQVTAKGVHCGEAGNTDGFLVSQGAYHFS